MSDVYIGQTLDVDRTNLAALKATFLEHSLTPEYMYFRSVRLIFNTKMQAGDTVDDYVAKMQHLAQTIKADEKIVRFAILNRLLPHISNYVTTTIKKGARVVAGS